MDGTMLTSNKNLDGCMPGLPHCHEEAIPLACDFNAHEHYYVLFKTRTSNKAFMLEFEESYCQGAHAIFTPSDNERSECPVQGHSRLLGLNPNPRYRKGCRRHGASLIRRGVRFRLTIVYAVMQLAKQARLRLKHEAQSTRFVAAPTCL